MNIPEEAKLTPEEIYNIYHNAKDKELSTSKAIADAASEKAYKAGTKAGREEVLEILENDFPEEAISIKSLLKELEAEGKHE